MSEHSDNIISIYRKYVLQTYANDLLFVRGKGSSLWDADGREYLDFTMGISVCNLGHCHPAVTKAIRQQAAKLVHISNLYINELQPVLAQKLVSNSFGEGAAFFCNSGAEANEGMIKLARKWGSDKGRFEIITMDDSFHGRTLATLAATGRAKYRKGFEPDTPGFSHVPFNNLQALEEKISDRTCAVMLEPVQGEGGIIPADAEYLKAVRALCDRKGVMLLFDEVQCGMGRTGTLFAWQAYGVQPDAFSLAKALGNGYPIGAFVIREGLRGVLTAGTHASTFGGTPLACAAACAVLDTIESKKLLERSNKMSRYFFRKLRALQKKYSAIRELRGKGLMIGIAMEGDVKEYLKRAREKGLLVISAGENVIRILPPLTVSRKEIDRAVDIIDQSVGGS